MFNTIDEVYSYLYTQKKLAKRENLDRIKFAKEKLKAARVAYESL